jgi:hypothetical protein
MVGNTVGQALGLKDIKAQGRHSTPLWAARAVACLCPLSIIKLILQNSRKEIRIIHT